jgi:hypothetical protein
MLPLKSIKYICPYLRMKELYSFNYYTLHGRFLPTTKTATIEKRACVTCLFLAVVFVERE